MASLLRRIKTPFGNRDVIVLSYMPGRDAWLAYWTPHQAVHVQAPGRGHPWTRQFTLIVPLSFQVYKWAHQIFEAS